MINYCFKNADSSIIGEEHGLNVQKEFENHKEQIANIVSELYAKKDTPGNWLKWMNLGDNPELIAEVNEYAQSVKDKFDNILVLGIGGSALGGVCVTEALLKPYWNLHDKQARKGMPRIFFLDNIDPDQMNAVFDMLDLKKTLVNVITKSGSTAETMSAFMIVKAKLEQALGADYKNNIVATTDKSKGILRKIADAEGLKTFVVPDDVGGRFSIFSAVGILPFALVDINISDLLKGVSDMDKELQNTNINENIAAQNALIHYLMDKKGKNLSVMMPYSSRLKYVSDWYVQLWAESLGKESDLDGKIVNAGPTPVKALGVTDQHSQVQLYNEGPNDKVITFVRLQHFDTELAIPGGYKDSELGYLCGRTINDLMNAEADSTKVAVTDYNRPNVTITLPKINAYYLGQLLYMFEMQTAIAGSLYNIDTFNQPGVEQAKNYTYALMGRAGYEETADKLNKKITCV